jgi:uncharacterized protein (DUF488 family)
MMGDMAEQNARTLYSIGHSNHTIEHFTQLLRDHGIDVLVDTRSSPYCRYTTHFNAEPLRAAVNRAGVKYLFLGRELGGRPEGEEFYDEQGHVLYWKVAESPLFREGLERVLQGAEGHRLALMCSEEDPSVCHRHLLVGRVLAGRGIQMQHIRGDGHIDSAEQVIKAARRGEPDPSELLFPVEGEPPWRSLQSVSPKSRPRSSSDCSDPLASGG